MLILLFLAARLTTACLITYMVSYNHLNDIKFLSSHIAMSLIIWLATSLSSRREKGISLHSTSYHMKPYKFEDIDSVLCFP